MLIECLDAAGSSPDDARARLAALDACGLTSRAVVINPDGPAAVAAPGGRGTGRIVSLPGDASAPRALRAECARAPATLTVIASAVAGGGFVAKSLPEDADLCWWPSAVPAERASAPSPASRALPGLAFDPLDAAVIDLPRGGRARPPLWDGDYLLAPVPLAGDAGREALEAFAAAAAEWSATDLVVLSDPQDEYERIARRLGVGMRVHFAGRAPCDAEVAWLSGASAIVLASDGPIAAGLVLRALVCGSPVLPAGAGAAGAGIRDWLVAHGCACAPLAPGTQALALAIERVLERGPDVALVIENGRAESDRRRPAPFATRLSPLLAARRWRARRAA